VSGPALRQARAHRDCCQAERNWRTFDPPLSGCVAFYAAAPPPRVVEPYVDIDRNDWLDVSADRPEQLAEAVGAWPDHYGRGLEEVRQTDRQRRQGRQKETRTGQ